MLVRTEFDGNVDPPAVEGVIRIAPRFAAQGAESAEPMRAGEAGDAVSKVAVPSTGSCPGVRSFFPPHQT